MTFDDACTKYDLLSIDGWMDAVGELPWLYEQAQRTEGLIVEIGTWQGRSAATIIAGLLDAGRPATNLICVDAFDGRGVNYASRVEAEAMGVGGMLKTFADNLTSRGLPMPTVIVAPSATIQTVCATRSIVADWVFIDGSHTAVDVRADLSAWGPLVCRGGLLSGHDYGDDVKLVVDELDRVEHPAGSIWTVRA